MAALLAASSALHSAMVLAKAGSVEKVTNAPSAPAASEGKMNICCRMTRSSFGPQALGAQRTYY